MLKKIKEKTLFGKIKFLFFPYWENPVIFNKWLFVAFLWWLNWIFHVLFLERFSYYLELWDKWLFLNLLKYYLLFVFLYETIDFCVNKWWWVELIPWTWSTISKKYLKEYVRLDNNFVEIQWTWKLISIIYGWIRQWWLSLRNLIEVWIKVILSILFAFYMVTKISSLYWLVFLVLFILFSLISVYFNGKLRVYRKKRNENTNIISKQVTKILMNKTEILQANKIDMELENISSLYDIDSKINKDMWVNRTLLKRSPELWISLFFILSYYILWNMYFNHNIWLNVVVWFGWALILMQRSIADALAFYVNFTKELVIIEKLWDVFENTPQISWYEEWKQFKHNIGEIEIKNITYWYNKKQPVFKDFNLKISWEKITALVWSSWSGKSTLIKLISGYIKADKWDIVIDKQKLNEISLKSYYNDVWYLTQEPSVFDGTVIDNLTYAIDRELKDWEIDEIIKLAKCEFIYDFSNWINTEIWERWVRLSWGQKQRLAIAKIFLKDPKIILLDEPTSALDSFSEELITKAMHNLFKWRTIIIIAHRLQTVKNADDIILIENWEIKERGIHRELVKKKWIYKKMLDLQSGF